MENHLNTKDDKKQYMRKDVSVDPLGHALPQLGIKHLPFPTTSTCLALDCGALVGRGVTGPDTGIGVGFGPPGGGMQ